MSKSTKYGRISHGKELNFHYVLECTNCNKANCLTCFNYNKFELKIEECVVTTSNTEYYECIN